MLKLKLIHFDQAEFVGKSVWVFKLCIFIVVMTLFFICQRGDFKFEDEKMYHTHFPFRLC